MHHVGEHIVHAAEIFGKFETTLILTQVADAASMIIVAKFEIIIRAAL